MPTETTVGVPPKDLKSHLQVAELSERLRARDEEYERALKREAAISDLLQVINSSSGNLAPVFDTILEKAHALCAAAHGSLDLYDGGKFRAVASRNLPGELLGQLQEGFTPGPNQPLQKLLAGEDYVQVADAAVVDDPIARLVVQSGHRTVLSVALRKNGKLLGRIVASRTEVRPFTDKDIALLRSFAAQAVIAMENARLLDELRGRTRELQESLDYQNAISEVIQVISRSTFDLAPVLQTLAETALRLCQADLGFVCRREGDVYRVVTAAGSTPETESNARTYQQYQQQHLLAADRSSLTGRVALEKRPVQIADVTTDPDYRLAQAPALGGIRTQVGVPLMREGVLIGVIIVSRQHVAPFSERQVDLLQVFADQAVIAIENTRLLTEQREALEQQTATAEVLEVINSSPGKLQPVFDAMLERAVRLSESAFGMMNLCENNRFRRVALRGVPQSLIEQEASLPAPGPQNALTRLLNGEEVVHIEDLAVYSSYRQGDLRSRGMVELAGARSLLAVALRKDGSLIGALTAFRQEVRPFSDKQIALLESFAAQAVIAIDNARLLDELQDRQAELRVTFDNMGDGVAMFDADRRLAAWNRNFEHIMGFDAAQLSERPTYAAYLGILAERGEFGTDNIEAELASRLEHADRELRLERTRPDGTVIEVRRNGVPGGGFVLIYGDVTERKKAEAEIAAARDAAEAALERQTATADILKVIASSQTDAQPVLDVVARAAVQYCNATDANIHLRDGDHAMSAAHDGTLRAAVGTRRPLDRRTIFGRAMLDRRTIHIPDVEALDDVEFATTRRLAGEFGFRAVIGAPLLREGAAIGSITLRRVDPGAFTPQQVELLETFAAQAVIAIENGRLFTELRESLEQQTATAEVLRVISQSPTDVAPVLVAVVGAARRFCGADDAMIVLRKGQDQLLSTHEGSMPALVGTSIPLDRSSTTGRACLEGRTVHVPDVSALDATEHAMTIELARRTNVRALLAAPMMRDGVAIGSVLLRKPEPVPFTPRQVALLETFAAQAVIAIENVRLFTELRDSLERLKAAQANLIQAEKMASLGQLTAGIAHEIKNPLNFVNNFAGLSGELVEELRQGVEAVLAEPDPGKRAELQETMDLLTGNLAKIVEHGRRADGIVKSMLAHSRGGTGDWQTSNINGLIEEALNLAFHGARAQDQSFNVTLERDFGMTLKPIDVVPQDITRVLLNLFGNGFYATRQRQLDEGTDGYQPTLRVSTRDLGEAVEVRVRDNGIGIAPEVRDKLFQPFFTTKPTGEGTGLGLSISYDIVTQQHGGSIELESEVGRFTEFTVRLPRARRAASGNRR